MSRPNNETVAQPEINRTYQPTIRNYFQTNDTSIQHQGYIDEIKSVENIRILTLNPKGINPWNNYKIESFLTSCDKYQIDIALMQETQVKWTPANVDKMTSRLQRLGREVLVVGADSNQWTITPNQYLPGGIMSAFLGKSRALIKEKEIHKSSMGNWMAVKLHHRNKTLVIINLYRIPAASSNGEICSLTQYNLNDGQAKSTNTYRKEIFSQIKDYLKKNDDIDDVIIAGDLNQDIASNEIQRFYRDIGVQDAHSYHNGIGLSQLDRTYIRGSAPIDSIALSNGIMEYVEGVKLFHQNEFVITDHRSYVIDINIQDYFDDEFSMWNQINKAKLNPSRKSHRATFYEELEYQLDIYNLESSLSKPSLTFQEIEILDETVTLILNKARKKVECQLRNIPYSHEKAKRQGTLMYWKTRVRQLKGVSVDEEVLEKRQSLHNIEVPNEVTIEIAKEKLAQAKAHWDELKENGNEWRKQYLMDHAKNKIPEEDLNEKQKDRIIKSVSK